MVHPDMSHMPGASAMTHQNTTGCCTASPIVCEGLHQCLTLAAVKWLLIHHSGPLFTYPLSQVSHSMKANITSSW